MAEISLRIDTGEGDVLGADVQLIEEEVHDLITKIEEGTIHLSYSSFKYFCVAPIQFIRYKLKKRGPKTPAMIFGDLVDTMVFPREEEGHRLWDRFVILEEMAELAQMLDSRWADLTFPLNGRTKLVKDFKKEVDFTAKEANLLVITRDQYMAACAIVDDLWRYPDSRWFLSQITSSQELKELEWRGFTWKYIPDGENPWMVGDLKMNSRKFSPARYLWTVTDPSFRYDFQGAIYTTLAGNEKTFFHLVYDTQQNIPAVFEFDPRVIHNAVEKMNYYMDEFERCIFQEAWLEGHGYFAKNGIYKLGL